MAIVNRTLKPVILALFCAAIVIFLLRGLFQGFMAVIFGSTNINFILTFGGIEAVFDPLTASPAIDYVLIYASPVILVIILTEISVLFIKKTFLGSTRFFLIAFILINLGYLIIHFFYNSFLLVMDAPVANDWLTLSFHLDLTKTGKIIFAFFLVFVTIGYINLVTRRVMKYINI